MANHFFVGYVCMLMWLWAMRTMPVTPPGSLPLGSALFTTGSLSLFISSMTTSSSRTFSMCFSLSSSFASQPEPSIRRWLPLP